MLTVAMVASVVVLGGVAYAAGGKKKMYACTKANHHPRELGPKVSCKKGEKRISWKVRGKKGDAGPRGPAGPRGERGATGSIGNVRTMTLNSPALINPAEGTVSDVSVWCTSTEQVVGGGFTFANDVQRDIVQQSAPRCRPDRPQGMAREARHDATSGQQPRCQGLRHVRRDVSGAASR